jgi:hypothetical protein
MDSPSDQAHQRGNNHRRAAKNTEDPKYAIQENERSPEFAGALHLSSNNLFDV